MKSKITSPMSAVSLVIVVLFTLLGSGGWSRAAPNEEEVQSAYERLVTIDFFAFGGVGIAGTPSAGENAFQTILRSQDGLKLLRKVLANGNPQARMYALAGIRKLAPKTFDAAAKSTLAGHATVRTLSGCIAMEENASDVIRRVAGGAYDLYLGRQSFRLVNRGR